MTSVNKPPRPENARDWLRYIKNAGEDRSWLLPHEQQLVGVVRKSLNTDREFRDGIGLLKEVVPYFLFVLFHDEFWFPILMDALVQAYNMQDKKLQIQILRFIVEVDTQRGNHLEANEKLSVALRSNVNMPPEMLVQAYTSLFKLQWFDLNNPVTTQLVDQAMEAERLITDPDLKAGMHNELARAFARLGNMSKALAHAQQAYVFWNSLENHPGKGRGAFTLATIYAYTGYMEHAPACFKKAEHFLSIAKEAIDHTDYVWKRTLLAYESGVQCLHRKEGEKAVDWMRVALREAELLNVPHYLAAAHHSMGLAQTMVKQYAESRESLKTAIELWKQLQNDFDRASAMQAMGYLEGLDGHKGQALIYLNEAMDICMGLMDTPQRQMMVNLIQESIDEL